MKTRRPGGSKRRAPRARATAPLRRTPIILDLDDGGDDVNGAAEAVGPNGAGERHSILTGGDVDADAIRAETSGEEAVGGSEPTPDQDIVDELGRALGIEHPDGEEFVASSEILGRRDRFRWHLERDAEDAAEGHPHHRRGTV